MQGRYANIGPHFFTCHCLLCNGQNARQTLAAVLHTTVKRFAQTKYYEYLSL